MAPIGFSERKILGSINGATQWILVDGALNDSKNLFSNFPENHFHSIRSNYARNETISKQQKGTNKRVKITKFHYYFVTLFVWYEVIYQISSIIKAFMPMVICRLGSEAVGLLVATRNPKREIYYFLSIAVASITIAPTGQWPFRIRKRN